MTEQQALDQSRVIGFAVLIGSLLLFYWLVMPVVIGSLADTRNIAEDRLGWLASTYSAGICLATFASIFWIRRINWVVLVKLGSVGTATGFALVAMAETYQQLIIAHAISSLFTGVAYAVIMALLGDSLHPARSYALVFFLQVVLGMAGSTILPLVASASETLQLVASIMILAALACSLMAHQLPTCGKQKSSNSTAKGGLIPSLPIALSLIAIILIFTGDSGIWVFLERIGSDGHNRVFGGTLVSLNLAAGAIGSLAAAWLGERLGYWWPMLTAVVLSIGSLGLFLMEDYRSALLAASFINGWAWNFGSAYRMALVARLDRSGRFTVLIPSMQTLGNTLGPTVTGSLLVMGGYPLTFTAIASLWCIALLCYFYAWRNYEDTDHVKIE